MHPYQYALIAVITRSISDIYYRIGMKTEIKPLITAMINSLIGGIFLSLLIDIKKQQITLNEVILIISANIFWSLQLYYHIKSYKTLDSAVNSLLDASRFVLISIISILIFQEEISLFQFMGISLITISVLTGVNFKRIYLNSGFYNRILSVIAGTVALSIDKYLTSSIDPNIVILSGFFLPALMYILVKPELIK